MNRRVLINPCDYLFWGQHRAARRHGEPGNFAFMYLDIEGELDSNAIKQTLAAAMRAHPTTTGAFAHSPFLGRPYWRLSNRGESPLEAAVESAYVYRDLRRNEDWERELCRWSICGAPVDLDERQGPLFRLEHYALPQCRARLCLRWPHMLMDAEGAQWFLRELSPPDGDTLPDRHGNPAAKPRSSLAADHETVDPLADYGFFARWGLFWKGTKYQEAHNRFRIETLPLAQGQNPKSKIQNPKYEHRVIHRNWSLEQSRRIQSAAKRTSPAGPALYARHLAAAIVRAIHRLYVLHDVATEAYLITMPLRVGFSKPNRSLFARRPLPGNYLVSPMLCIPRDHADDPAAIGDDILAQLTDYQDRKGDLMQWSMMWAASLLHAWIYRLIFLLPFGSGRFATGFSFYGEIDRPVRSICGARVLNLWGGGPNTTPPGWNPVFSRFDGRLNFTLTYTWPAISDDLAGQYVGLIEEQVFRED